MIDLVRRMLKAVVMMPDGTRNNFREGTPQGSPLSPLLSNIVLDELDQELARRGHQFVRYGDDCNVFVELKTVLTKRSSWSCGVCAALCATV